MLASSYYVPGWYVFPIENPIAVAADLIVRFPLQMNDERGYTAPQRSLHFRVVRDEHLPLNDEFDLRTYEKVEQAVLDLVNTLIRQEDQSRWIKLDFVKAQVVMSDQFMTKYRAVFDPGWAARIAEGAKNGEKYGFDRIASTIQDLADAARPNTAAVTVRPFNHDPLANALIAQEAITRVADDVALGKKIDEVVEINYGGTKVDHHTAGRLNHGDDFQGFAHEYGYSHILMTGEDPLDVIGDENCRLLEQLTHDVYLLFTKRVPGQENWEILAINPHRRGLNETNSVMVTFGTSPANLTYVFHKEPGKQPVMTGVLRAYGVRMTIEEYRQLKDWDALAPQWVLQDAQIPAQLLHKVALSPKSGNQFDNALNDFIAFEQKLHDVVTETIKPLVAEPVSIPHPHDPNELADLLTAPLPPPVIEEPPHPAPPVVNSPKEWKIVSEDTKHLFLAGDVHRNAIEVLIPSTSPLAGHFPDQYVASVSDEALYVVVYPLENGSFGAIRFSGRESAAAGPNAVSSATSLKDRKFVFGKIPGLPGVYLFKADFPVLIPRRSPSH